MIRWIRKEKIYNSDSGETIIIYLPVNTKGLVPAGIWIESRKRLVISDKSRRGWLKATYHLMDLIDARSEEFYSLRDAKEAALERL